MPYERYSPYTLYKPTYLHAIESITESIPGIIHSSSKLEVSRAQKDKNKIPHQAKSAICQLNELRRGLTYHVAQYGPPHAPSFEAKVEIDGQIFVGTGKKIKEAKEAAARKALDALPLSSKAFWASRERCLSVTDSPYSSTAFVPLAIPVPPKLPFVQEISNHFEDLLHSHYRTLVPLLPVGQEHFQVMAGIVMTAGTRKEDAEVIVLTTGNKCITSLSLCAQGLAVNDCHAEVIASRAFRLFLWNQIDLFLHSGNSGRSIFVWNENRSHLRLKSNVKFHFYINTAPCGDARNFNVPDNADPVSTVLIDRNPNRKSRGLLRVKVEEGEGSIPVPSTARENWSWEAITTKKARLCTMSCSDKLARWNVLGLQGALLSNFVEPIYMSSISIARKFHLEHLQRGLFGRLSSEINSRRLPIPFVFNQPLIGLPNRAQDDTYVKQSAPKYSLNWFRGCQKPEIVRTSSGKLYSGEVSRLCKAKFAERFIALSQTVCGADCKLVEATYAGLKAKAHTYQESKHTLYNSFEEAGLGNWIRKPPEQDAFLVSKTPA